MNFSHFYFIVISGVSRTSIVIDYYYTYIGDFMVEADIDGSIFHQNSSINATVCFTFTTVNDNIVEGNETFEFIPSASNILDKFAEGYDEFSLVVYDDDGTYMYNTL